MKYVKVLREDNCYLLYEWIKRQIKLAKMLWHEPHGRVSKFSRVLFADNPQMHDFHGLPLCQNNVSAFSVIEKILKIYKCF
jgi:hypothetical protein